MTFEQAKSLQIKRKAELEVLQQKQQQYREVSEKDKLEYEAFKQRLRKEQIDVEKLEGTSLVSILAKCFGQYEKKHEKEQREYLDIKERMDQFVYGMEQNERELHRLEDSIHQLNEEISERKQWMIQTFEEAKIEWTEEEEKKSKVYKEREENAETIRRIKRLLSVVESAKQQYKSAAKWAKYDTFFGGGPFCDWEKYEAIDKATKTMSRLVSLTAELNKEVKDIEVIYDVNIKVFDRTTRVYDRILDGTEIDWMVKDQISDCLNYITHYMERLELLKEKLQEKQRTIEEQLEKLEDK